MKNKTRSKSFKLPWFHWAIIIISLFLTLFAWYFTKQQTDKQSQNAFNLEVTQVVAAIQQRMGKYEDALWSAAAHITVVNNKIDARSWKKYASQLNLTEKYPGINGVGVIYDIRRENANEFIQQQKKIRHYFNIHPTHNNSRLLPIVYIEPYESNRKAVGLDMAHEINRYTAAVKTEMSGKAQITGPITLVQDAKRTPGFLLFVPLYSTEAHKKFIGLVYAPFIMHKLIVGSMGNTRQEVSLEISDNHVAMFHDKNPVISHKPSFQKTILKKMYGRVWKINFSSTPMFDENNISQEPIYILIGGICVDILLLLLFISLTRANKKALDYADLVTEDLNDKTIALDKLAFYDELTGLPNRTGFFMTLESSVKRARENNSNLSVAIIDIDDFKRVNDSRGYEVGDEFLCHLAESFKGITSKSTHLSRLGADEFGLIIEFGKSQQALLQQLNKYIKLMTSEDFTAKLAVPASISIGAAMYPTAGRAAKSLYISADIANNAAKEAGGNRCVLFNDSLSFKVKRHHELDFSIRKAVENDEFRLVYQPQIDLETHKLVGFEALLRWHSSVHGDVSPNEFIAIAEENNAILKIGQWTIKQVCNDLERFKRETKLDNIIISLNSSIVEILHPSYKKIISKVLQESTIKGSELCVEVTESVLMKDPAKIIDVLNELRLLGVSISLDDFGTGYSSLKYLKDLPVSTLKIDKSFIDDITESDSRSIVENIIQLSRSLNLTVLAEGAELEEQVEVLKTLNCDYVQGYFFYKPLSLTDAINEFKSMSGADEK